MVLVSEVSKSRPISQVWFSKSRTTLPVMKVFLCCALGLVAVFDCVNLFGHKKRETLKMIKSVAK